MAEVLEGGNQPPGVVNERVPGDLAARLAALCSGFPGCVSVRGPFLDLDPASRALMLSQAGPLWSPGAGSHFRVLTPVPVWRRPRRPR